MDNKNEYAIISEKVFDYFLVAGINRKFLNGNKTIEEVKAYEPEMLAIFPENNEKEVNLCNLINK
jgi:hypothetical protein